MHLISYSAFGRAVGAHSLTSIHLPLPPQTPAVPAHHILLIDASGSMWGDMDQMQAQREASFFVIGAPSASQPADVLVMAVVPEAQPYTVRIPATTGHVED